MAIFMDEEFILNCLQTNLLRMQKLEKQVTFNGTVSSPYPELTLGTFGSHIDEFGTNSLVSSEDFQMT